MTTEVVNHPTPALVVPPSPSTISKLSSIWMTLSVIAYGCVVGLLISRHEPWADEAQAWLIARDSSLLETWRSLAALEGSPALWQTVLHFVAHAGLPYGALNVTSGLLGLIAAVLCVRYAPFPLFIRTLLPFTYFLCFQYAVVARSYALVPALLFSSVAAFRCKTHPAIWAVLLSLLAMTSAQGFLLSVALACSICIYTYRRRSNIGVLERRSLIQAGAGYVLLLLAVVWIVWPSKQATFVISPNWSLSNLVGISRYAIIQAFGPGYLPLAVVALGVPLLARGAGLPFFVVSAILLCVFGAVVYSNVWHHGMLVLALMAALWLSWEGGWAAWLASAALILLIVSQGFWTWQTARYDWKNAYSGSKSMAAYLKQERPFTQRLFAIGFPTVAVQPYFPANIFENYSTAGTSRPSYWRWSRTNQTNDASELLGSEHPDRVLLGYSSPSDERLWRYLILQSGYHEVIRSGGSLFWRTEPFQTESYELFAAGKTTRNAVLSSSLPLADPAIAHQLLWGFSDGGTGAGLWGGQSVGLAIQRPCNNPECRAGANLTITFDVPASEVDKAPVRSVRAYVSGHKLHESTVRGIGSFRLMWTVSEADLFWRIVPVSFQFEASGLPATASSQRVALVREVSLSTK